MGVKRAFRSRDWTGRYTAKEEAVDLAGGKWRKKKNCRKRTCGNSFKTGVPGGHGAPGRPARAIPKSGRNGCSQSAGRDC